MFQKGITQDQYLALYDKLTAIERTLNIMAASQADLDAGIAAVQAAVTQLGTDLTAAITALQAKIGNGASGTADFTSEVASLTAIANTLSGLDATAVAASAGSPQNPNPNPNQNPPGNSAIVSTPASVVITGGVGSKATITVANSANPSATFTVTSNNANVTVAPGSVPSSFVVTEAVVGSAVLTIKDNSTPANTQTVNVTAS